MKSLISILLLITINSCHIERTWIVKGYTQDYSGNWLVECQSGKKVKQFIIECRPDSVGVKFKY